VFFEYVYKTGTFSRNDTLSSLLTYKQSRITNVMALNLNNDNSFDLIVNYYKLSDKTQIFTDIMIYMEKEKIYKKLTINNLSTNEDLSGIMVSDLNGDGL